MKSEKREERVQRTQYFVDTVHVSPGHHQRELMVTNRPIPSARSAVNAECHGCID
jgi:hypothetical protein